MNLHFYWTDKVYLTLILMAAFLVVYTLSDAQNRHIIFKILQKPLAQSAAIVLFFFTVISVVDSIHDGKQTLLDKGLSPMGAHYEKSYSAPFSLHLFYSEMVLINGMSEQIYPKLLYPKDKLKTEDDVSHFVFYAFLKSMGIGFAAALGVSLIVVSILMTFSLKAVNYNTYLPSVITVGVLVAISFFAYETSRCVHVLGTGKIGEDILYYGIKSIRTGLVIGLVTTLIMMPFAIVLGILAGYLGGWVDDLIQYVYTTLSSVPGVLLITAAVLSFDTYVSNHPAMYQSLSELADMRLMVLCLILGLTSWTSLCRLIRGEVLKLRELEFMLAAQALGSSLFYSIRKHIIPNIMHLILMTLVLDFSFLVLAEAVLSYVGVGVSPMTMSWGNMINASRLELAREPAIWWPVATAFLFMFSLVLASNIMSDAFRDGFDPHHDAL